MIGPTRQKLLWFLVALLSLPYGGCRSTHKVEGLVSEDGESRVQEIITGLWTPDTQIIQKAVAAAATVKDPRIAEALVGKLAEDETYTPEHPFHRALVDSLEFQGYKVELLPESQQYSVQWSKIKHEVLVPTRAAALVPFLQRTDVEVFGFPEVQND